MRQGQAMTETVLLLPIYLFIVFGLLQVSQLAVGALVANYAASAIAREAVRDGSTGNQGSYTAKFQGLLAVGMKNPEVNVEPDNRGLLSNVTVHACAQIDALPFVGQFLTFAVGQRYNGGGGCGTGGVSMGAFYFNGAAPYAFRVHGKATARMNYKPS